MIHIFYADRHHASAKDMMEYLRLAIYADYELYNGAYIFRERDQAWFRPDWTPVLLEDVPPGTRACLLLIT